MPSFEEFIAALGATVFSVLLTYGAANNPQYQQYAGLGTILMIITLTILFGREFNMQFLGALFVGMLFTGLIMFFIQVFYAIVVLFFCGIVLVIGIALNQQRNN